MSRDAMRAAEDAEWKATGGPLRALSVALYFASGVAVIIGLVMTYGDFRVVGADAYNLIIYSVRGVMFAVIGLIFAVAATAARIIVVLREDSAKETRVVPWR